MKNTGDLETMIEQMQTAVILPDIHVPYHDSRAIGVVLKYIKERKPDVIVQLGDFYDCYSLSKYDKDPSRIDSLQEEIDEGTNIWKQIKRASPKSKLVMLEGNHCKRIQRFLMKNPGMYSLAALKPSTLFGLDKLGIEYVPSDKTFKLNSNLVLSHGAVDDGCKLSQHSGYSAKNTLDKWGNVSGVIGHSHRMGSSLKTLADGTIVQWVEAGCLCTTSPDYVKHPNWQQGFCSVYFSKNRFHITPVVITNYEFIADGKRYK